MSKKQARIKQGNGKPAGRRKSMVIILILMVLIGTGVLGQVISKKKSQKESVSVAPAALTANTPSKEYVYAGGKLIATDEPTKNSFGDDAMFISMVLPEPTAQQPENCAFCLQGQNYTVRITMKNTGTTTWTPSLHKLGTQNPPNNTNFTVNRATLPSGVTVPPGSNWTFEFTAAKVPTVGGPYAFQWQMYREGDGFFGEKTTTRNFYGGSALPQGVQNYASFVSQTVPSFMFAGQSYSVSVTMHNEGGATWTTANGYKLGSMIPEDNTTWGMNRVNLPILPGSVPPNTDVTFTFTVTAPATAGTSNFQWQMVQDGGVGFFGAVSPPTAIIVNSKAAMGYLDYNLDHKTDVASYKPSNGQWTIDTNLNGTTDFTYTFGGSSYTPIPGDYDGDGKGDLVTLKTSSFTWYFDFDRNGVSDQSFIFGQSGDIPVPQDYNGDRQADVAVFRPSSGQWIIDTNRNGTADLTITFGQSGDIPCPADYDGDGLAELSVFRPSTEMWLYDTNRDGTAEASISYGATGDLPVPMDYNRDGKADFAVFRPSTSEWLISIDGNRFPDITVTLSVADGDIPVAGDYDGDGYADIAVYRPSNQKWYIDTDRNGTVNYTITHGQSGNIPLRQNGWILKLMGLTSL